MGLVRFKDIGDHEMGWSGVYVDLEVHVHTGFHDRFGTELSDIFGVEITDNELLEILRLLPSVGLKLKEAAKEVLVKLFLDKEKENSDIVSCGCGWDDWNKKYSEVKKSTKPGFVYLLMAKGEDIIKIGITTAKKLSTRVDSIKTNTPHNLSLVGYIEVEDAASVEKKLHNTFSSKRLNREWFKVSPSEAIKEYGNFGKFKYAIEGQDACL